MSAGTVVAEAPRDTAPGTASQNSVISGAAEPRGRFSRFVHAAKRQGRLVAQPRMDFGELRENRARLARELRERDAAGKLPPGAVAPALAEAFAAFEARDWNRAIGLLEAALPETVRIGGSRAQRDLAEFTLRAACAQAGRAPPARRAAGA